ncbi:MAG TPA: YqgE/AlgH family protein [Candidatus Marinimicrobia bacterium]|jgi:putative transcriptional regulator|nr:YqgE/AlgH family protein [Candidatus Neomarinimicrobiota bacterium]
MASLINQIIISMPHMQDPYFGRAVVFICEHNKDGALGFIVNKPFETLELQDLFSDFFPDDDDILKLVPDVYFGGPVLVERGIVLHSADYEIESTIAIGNDFSLTSNKTIIKEIAKKKGPKHSKLMLGHAGWKQYQLEAEIENGDWLLQHTNLDFIFNTEEKFMWDMATKSFGINMSEFSGLGGSA